MRRSARNPLGRPIGLEQLVNDNSRRAAEPCEVAERGPCDAQVAGGERQRSPVNALPDRGEEDVARLGNSASDDDDGPWLYLNTEEYASQAGHASTRPTSASLRARSGTRLTSTCRCGWSAPRTGAKSCRASRSSAGKEPSTSIPLFPAAALPARGKCSAPSPPSRGSCWSSPRWPSPVRWRHRPADAAPCSRWPPAARSRCWRSPSQYPGCCPLSSPAGPRYQPVTSVIVNALANSFFTFFTLTTWLIVGGFALAAVTLLSGPTIGPRRSGPRSGSRHNAAPGSCYRRRRTRPVVR